MFWWAYTLVWIFVGIAVIVLGVRFTWPWVEYRLTSSRVQRSPEQIQTPEPSTALTGEPPNAGGSRPLSPESDPQVDQRILRKEFESVNIGGAVVLMQTSPQASSEEIAVIFNRVKDKEALVNLALVGTVTIEEVKLITVDRDPRKRKFAVSMLVKNLSGADVKVRIPKGQVFENKRLKPIKQNLAAVGDGLITIPASFDRLSKGFPIWIEALCINKGFNFPNGDDGNITIFEINNKKFVDQPELWAWVEEKLDNVRSLRPLVRKDRR